MADGRRRHLALAINPGQNSAKFYQQPPTTVVEYTTSRYLQYYCWYRSVQQTNDAKGKKSHLYGICTTQHGKAQGTSKTTANTQTSRTAESLPLLFVAKKDISDRKENINISSVVAPCSLQLLALGRLPWVRTVATFLQHRVNDSLMQWCLHLIETKPRGIA